MSLTKAYSRTTWENYPSDKTPLNETNLNHLEIGVDEIDNRVISLDTKKFDKTEAAGLIKSFELDKTTGIITITKYNGSVQTIDTLLEKIAVNFDFDSATQKLIITLDDGTTKEIDLSAFITQYEFLDSDTIAFTVDSAGKVKAIVKEGSIKEKHLQPNYLADIKTEVAKAEASKTAAAQSEANAKVSETNAKTSETNAKTSETNAATSASTATEKATAAGNSATSAANSAKTATEKATAAQASAEAAKTSETNAKISETNSKTSETNAKDSETIATEKATSATESATKSESYAVGGTNTRDGENTDNSKYYSEKAEASSNTAKEYLSKVEQAGADAVDVINNAVDVNTPAFSIDLSTGHLMYESTRFVFNVNNLGHLEWGLTV